MSWTFIIILSLLLFFFSQTAKFSGAVLQQDSPSPVSMAVEAEPGQEEEHENMKNFLTSSSLSAEQRGLRRSRAVRSKRLCDLSALSPFKLSVLSSPRWATKICHSSNQNHNQNQCLNSGTDDWTSLCVSACDYCHKTFFIDLSSVIMWSTLLSDIDTVT